MEATSMEAHDAAVGAMAAQVKRFHEQQRPFRIFHGATNSTRRSRRRADDSIDTSGLRRVLGVDTAALTAVAEPNVAMDALVDATLRHGLVPLVVMEFPGITVGGGFSGTSGESSSFRHGAFDATVAGVELVLADGRVERASAALRPELFWGAASAFGTLAVVTLLEVRLRPAAAYVRLTYGLASNAGEAVARMREACADEANDYVDAIAFAADAAVVCVGRLTDDAEGRPPRRFTRRRDAWFYLRAREVLRQLQRAPAAAETVDMVPLVDYLFRYDRGGFWVARYAFRYFATPFNRATRWALDPWLRARAMYRALHTSGLADAYMIQDVGVPVDGAAELHGWLDATLAIYPLWLCPLRTRRDGPDAGHGLHAGFARPDAPDLVNFGVWGPLPRGQRDGAAAARLNRALERKVRDLGGFKWLYAQTYYSEDEFWAHYDRAAYDALRLKYGAAYLPSVYDKVRAAADDDASTTWRSRAKARVADIWPLRGLYGVASAVVGAEYLLQRGGKRGEDKQ